MKNKMRKLLGILTALAIICAMIPATGITALAAPSASTTSSGTDITDRFPDPKFRQAIREELYIKPFDPITQEAVSAIMTLNVFGRGITSLVGIECFTNLRVLDCSYNQLASLDVSTLRYLTRLQCNDNYLTSLKVDGLTTLEFLECTSNLLTTLNVRSLTQLRTLLCGNNRLTSLDARGLHQLVTLECRDNNLTSLNLGHFLDGSSDTIDPLRGLKYLNCRNNLLTSWLNPTLQPGLGVFQSLETFIIGGNLLTSLNVSNYPKLEVLCCCHNMLTSLTLHSASYETWRYDACIKSNRLSNPNNIPDRTYSDIDFRYNQFSPANVDNIVHRLGFYMFANRIKSTPQNLGNAHVVRISDHPTMAVVGADTMLSGTVLGITGSGAIAWSLVQWSGIASTNPTIRNSTTPPGTFFKAQTTGIAIVEARVVNGKAPGVDYLQYIRIEVVEPLSFAHSEEFDIPTPSSSGDIIPVYVRSGVSGGIPPFVFSSVGLPSTLELNQDGLISGKLPAGASGSMEITVTDARGNTATITVYIGMSARSYTIGGVNPGGVNWYPSLDALLSALGGSWGSISKADITLLGDVTGSTTLEIGTGQNITLNLGIYGLAITSTGTAASIGSGGKLNVAGEGALSLVSTTGSSGLNLDGGELVKGQNVRIDVDGVLYATNGAAAEVSSVMRGRSRDDYVGVVADNGSKITVKGDVSVAGPRLSTCVGVRATRGATVTVGGSVSVTVFNETGGTGVSVDGADTVVTVMGDVSAGVGVHAVSNGAAVYIHGEIGASGTYINFVNDMGANMPVTKEPYPETEIVGGVVFHKYIGDMKDVAKPSVVYVRSVLPGALSGTVTIGLNNSNGLLTANTSAVVGGSGAFTYTWSGTNVVNSGASTLVVTSGYRIGQEVTLTLTRAGVTGSLTAKITVYQPFGIAQANGTTGTFSIPASFRVAGDIVTGTYGAGNSTGVTFRSLRGPAVVELVNTTATYKVNPDDAVIGSGLIQITAIFEGGPTILYGDVNRDGVVDITDAAYMNRYLAKWPGYSEKEVDIIAADVDISGDVNIIDVAVLNRYMAKWPEYPKLPHVTVTPQVGQQMAMANASIIGEPAIRIGQAAGKAGDTVRIPISLERNPGITGMIFTVEYDKTALKLVGYENTGLLAGAQHTTESVLYSATFAWINPFALTNNTGNGALVYVDFEILEGATIGATAITLTHNPNNIVNADLRPVAFDTVPGSVAVRATPVITAATANFISIVETAKNSGVWALSLTVTETWSDGERRIAPYSIEIWANNANVNGRYDLGSYTLVYDIAGNGSNVKEFRIILG